MPGEELGNRVIWVIAELSHCGNWVTESLFFNYAVTQLRNSTIDSKAEQFRSQKGLCDEKPGG